MFGVALAFVPFASANSTTFFGGRIVAVIDCDSTQCGGASRAIIVGPPRWGIFMETRDTRWYEYGRGDTPNWTVGQASSGSSCRIYNPMTGCITILVGREIDFAGTSKMF